MPTFDSFRRSKNASIAATLSNNEVLVCINTEDGRVFGARFRQTEPAREFARYILELADEIDAAREQLRRRKPLS